MGRNFAVCVALACAATIFVGSTLVEGEASGSPYKNQRALPDYLSIAPALVCSADVTGSTWQLLHFLHLESKPCAELNNFISGLKIACPWPPSSLSEPGRHWLVRYLRSAVLNPLAVCACAASCRDACIWLATTCQQFGSAVGSWPDLSGKDNATIEVPINPVRIHNW